MRACHSSALHCKLFGETLICIGVSSVVYSSINRQWCQLVGPIGHGASAAGAGFN
jgi:hypothetical protein